MPIVNISISGKNSTSASGEVTDTAMLAQLKSLVSKMTEESLKELEAKPTT